LQPVQNPVVTFSWIEWLFYVLNIFGEMWVTFLGSQTIHNFLPFKLMGNWVFVYEFSPNGHTGINYIRQARDAAL
jgi:hypothetical protein